MSKTTFKIFILSLGFAWVSPVRAAPTDPTASGTMDVSNDRNDTNADVNVNKPPVPPAASTMEPAKPTPPASSRKVNKPKRRSPKVIPPNPNTPKVDDPAGNLDTMTPAAGSPENAAPSSVTPPTVPQTDTRK